MEASHVEKCRKAGKEVESESTVTIKEMKGDVSDGLKRFFTSILKKYTIYNLKEFSKVIKHCNNNLKDIHSPTLLIWGRLDQLVPFVSVKHILGYCRNDQTKLIEYPDVSHLMLYSSAHYKITDEILKFIYRTAPPKLPYKRIEKST